MKVRKSVREIERNNNRRKKRKEFDQVRECTRMQSIGDERFLEVQNMSEFKDRKEQSNE